MRNFIIYTPCQIKSGEMGENAACMDEKRNTTF
jgi:hypothetical protein